MIKNAQLISNKYPQGEEMITKSLLTNHHYRRNVVDYIVENNCSVIDVGGAMNPWVDVEGAFWYEKKIVDAYFDCNCEELSTGHAKLTAVFFNANMSNWWEWDELLEYVSKNGKFDFSVCTQTLEDIRDPITVLKMLPMVSKEGYIDVPSKYLELGKGREGDSMNPAKDMPEWGIREPIFGYVGHRWIMNMIDNVLWLLPKLPFIEVLDGINCVDNELIEGIDEDGWAGNEGPNGFLSFWWENDISYRVVGDDFLGPNPPAVFNMYRECLNKGL